MQFDLIFSITSKLINASQYFCRLSIKYKSFSLSQEYLFFYEYLNFLIGNGKNIENIKEDSNNKISSPKPKV